MKKVIRKKILFFSFVLLSLILSGISYTWAQNAQNQSKPATDFTYNFFSFQKSYDALLGAGKSGAYQVTEKQIDSIFGKYLLIMEKSFQTYNENLFIFFNEKKEPIFIKISYILKSKKSRSTLEKLFIGIKDVLVQKYGESTRDDLPYYRIFQEKYELLLSPLFAASISFDLQVKYLVKYSAYVEYYNAEMTKQDDQDIQQIIDQY